MNDKPSQAILITAVYPCITLPLKYAHQEEIKIAVLF